MNMEIIDKLEKKFNWAMPDPPEPGAVEPDPVPSGPPGHWRDSPTVVALADYVAKRPWVRLGTYAGCHIGIRFDPGITITDAKRWAEVRKIWSMLCDAEADLDYLMGQGMLKLPVIEAGQPSRPRPKSSGRRTAAGPSRRPKS